MINVFNLIFLFFTISYPLFNHASSDETVHVIEEEVAGQAVFSYFLYPIGEKIHSQTDCYTVLKELGEGAFGRVYSVQNTVGKTFALKCHKHQDSSHVFSDAEREYHRGQVLSHPNIIKSFELFNAYIPFEGSVTAHLVLELVEGKTLGKYECYSFTQEQSVRAASQFLRAIEYAFSLELMHWDLHGENVMIDKNINFRIIDLASFYSFDELFESFKEASKKEDPQVEAKQRKLREILRKNPRLQAHLKQIHQRKNELLQMPNYFLKKWKNKALVQEDYHRYSPLYSEYFYNVVYMCKLILSKSNCDDSFNLLMLEMDDIASGYISDIEQQKELHFRDYLSLLIQLIERSKL